SAAFCRSFPDGTFLNRGLGVQVERRQLAQLGDDGPETSVRVDVRVQRPIGGDNGNRWGHVGSRGMTVGRDLGLVGAPAEVKELFSNRGTFLFSLFSARLHSQPAPLFTGAPTTRDLATLGFVFLGQLGQRSRERTALDVMTDSFSNHRPGNPGAFCVMQQLG